MEIYKLISIKAMILFSGRSTYVIYYYILLYPVDSNEDNTLWNNVSLQTVCSQIALQIPCSLGCVINPLLSCYLTLLKKCNVHPY